MKYWITGIALLGADIGSKWAAQKFLIENTLTIFPDFFDLMLTFNEGVAFSLPLPRFLQILVTLCFLVYFFFWAAQNFSLLSAGEKWGSILIVSGAIGNFLERVFSGSVTDFLSFHYYQIFSFPVFNLADIFIFLGVVSWILGSFSKPQKTEEIS